MSKPVIYTIGHSTHRIEYFLGLIQEHGVNCLVDVRSVAASRFNPQYNKKALAASLAANEVQYLHMPEEFGARRSEPDILDSEGRVDFDKVRDSEKFMRGIGRLWNGVEKRFTIVLMCSEAEPLQCHRFGMIAPALLDFDVRHILKDKSIVPQNELEARLLKMYDEKLNAGLFELFVSDSDRLGRAYRILNKEIAYSPAQHTRKGRQ